MARYGGTQLINKLHVHVTGNKGNPGNSAMLFIHSTIIPYGGTQLINKLHVHVTGNKGNPGNSAMMFIHSTIIPGNAGNHQVTVVIVLHVYSIESCNTW